MNHSIRDIQIKFGVWLERLTTVAVVLVAAAAMCRAFWRPIYSEVGPVSTFARLQDFADVLRREPDSSRREFIDGRDSIAVDARHFDAILPVNARVFVSGVLGPENFGLLGDYCTLEYFLFPREVAISLGEPPAYHRDEVAGRSPASLADIQQAGYGFALELKPEERMCIELGSSRLLPRDTQLKPIPGVDWIIAWLLPLAVAITGSRLVRWLFRDLNGILSAGELLASGLAVGTFFLTQMTLGLRLAGVRLEQVLATAIAVWAVGEAASLFRRWGPRRPQLQARQLWWLLLVPASLVLWSQFRLSGLTGLMENDGVMIWAFKGKMLHYYSGKELWACFRNPTFAYAHLDYPLLVPMLHALTYGALGHVNEFVTKFWNQWMLLLLAWAVLASGRFPERRPCLAAAVVSALVLLPMSRCFALMEGATIPMVFYVVFGSVQLAIGMLEKQSGRLRLGLLLLMAAGMVKFEGMLLLGLWTGLLLLDRDSRAAVWPPLKVSWAGFAGLAAWVPYLIFRLNQHVPYPEAGWTGQLFTNTGIVLGMLPMTWVAMLSGRFLDYTFAVWTSPDNQHALWAGHWMGWSSLVDPWTQGLGWACMLLLVVAWLRDGRFRRTGFGLFLVFLMFATLISIVWSAVHSNPLSYQDALLGVLSSTGGRYLYPVLMAWFVAGSVLVLRTPAPRRI